MSSNEGDIRALRSQVDRLETSYALVHEALAQWRHKEIEDAVLAERLRAALDAISALDTRRIDWMSEDDQRLQYVYWRMQNEGETVRQAVDALMAMAR